MELKKQGGLIVKKPTFQNIPLGSIKPIGWLKKQLEIQANGLTGNLEEIWEDVGLNSGWLGGNGENWERGPYYCDGLIPLAYILEDKSLIEKSKKWIEWTLNSQRSDGFFGPESNKDWWPRMVMLKVITQYYEATKDNRVPSFLKKYFRYQLKSLRSHPLKMWATARGFENVLSIFWLYERSKDEFLIDLIDSLFEQSINWSHLFEDFPYKKPTDYYLNWEEFHELLSKGDFEGLLDSPEKFGISKAKVQDLFYKYHTTHIVNVAMAFKEPALKYLRYGDEKYKKLVFKAIENVMKYHGMPNGMFSGDEHLNGKNPTQGTELCAVVEYMFSLENLFKIFGMPVFGDILEKVAYNALPATIKPDFCAHQYDQQVNQVLCNIAPRNWYNNGDDSNIFGLEPNFGCCTANMHQGWPKFVSNLWMIEENTFVNLAYAPCKLEYEFSNGSKIEIIEETDYPFDDEVNITILKDEREIALKLRIPNWSDHLSLKVNDENFEIEKGDFIEIKKLKPGKNTIRIRFSPKIRFSKWYQDSISVERGPLLFGLRIGEEWKKVAREEPFADYEVYPRTPWNYALDLSQDFEVEKLNTYSEPFNPDNPPIIIHTKGFKLNNWKIVDNSAGPIPKVSTNDITDQVEDIQLIPYGCSNLRIAEFPWIDSERS